MNVLEDHGVAVYRNRLTGGAVFFYQGGKARDHDRDRARGSAGLVRLLLHQLMVLPRNDGAGNRDAAQPGFVAEIFEGFGINDGMKQADHGRQKKVVDISFTVDYTITVVKKAEYPLSPWRKGDPG